jgi:peptidoglycan/LPS O-acetylase OafA/YrhL
MDSSSAASIPELSSGVAHAVTSGRTKTKHPRLNSLDLLRGLAAFAVMIPHFLMYSSAGDGGLTAEIISACAVEVFFVLSGFVLGPQVLLCMERGDLRTYKIFLIRRWMRTVPPYLIALVCVAIVFRQFGSADFFKYGLYVGNLFDQHLNNDFFPVAWSLAVEEWYYVVFPLALIITAPFLRRTGKQAIIVGIGFVVAIALIRLLFASDEGWGEHTRRIVIFRIDSIAYGFLLYLWVSKAHSLRDKLPQIGIAFLVSTALIYTINLGAVQDANRIYRDVHPFVSAAFGCSAILLFIALEERLSFTERLASYMGRISYPVYLLHLPAIYILTALLQSQALWVQFITYVISAVAIATAFNWWIERPILAARPGY